MAKLVWVNLGSGNGLLTDGNKSLPEPMLTNQWGSSKSNFTGNTLVIYHWYGFIKEWFMLTFTFPRGQLVNRKWSCLDVFLEGLFLHVICNVWQWNTRYQVQNMRHKRTSVEWNFTFIFYLNILYLYNYVDISFYLIHFQFKALFVTKTHTHNQQYTDDHKQHGIRKHSLLTWKLQIDRNVQINQAHI